MTGILQLHKLYSFLIIMLVCVPPEADHGSVHLYFFNSHTRLPYTVRRAGIAFVELICNYLCLFFYKLISVVPEQATCVKCV